MSQTRFLMLYFVIFILGLFGVGALVWVLMQRSDGDALLAIGEAQNERAGQHFNRLFADDLDRLPDEISDLGVQEYTLIQEGEVVYSTDAAKVGQPFDENPDSQTALRQQHPVSVRDETQVTTYLPVEGGLAEITSDLSRTEDVLADRRADILAAVLVGLVLLMTVTAVLVSVFSDTMRQQVSLLENQTSALMLQLVSRADFSHMSLLALQIAFRKLNPATADANTLRGYQEIEELAHNLALVEKMERLQLELEKKPFALDELLRERAMQFKDAEVSLGEHSGLGLIADRAMVAHAIDAILHNINGHNVRQRAIKLSSSNSNGMTRITAALPIVEYVDTLKRVNPNQHIDLTVARLMVERHGGNLEFNYSDGIHFHIVLPSA